MRRPESGRRPHEVLIAALRAPRLHPTIGNSTQTTLNCREGDISILTPGSHPPIRVRDSCPYCADSVSFQPDLAICARRPDRFVALADRPSVGGWTGTISDRMRTFRFPCIRDFLGRIHGDCTTVFRRFEEKKRIPHHRGHRGHRGKTKKFIFLPPCPLSPLGRYCDRVVSLLSFLHRKSSRLRVMG